MRTLFFLLLLLVPSYVSAQSLAGTFLDAKEEAGISIQELDEQYQSALHANPKLAVFKGQEDEFIAAYKNMLGSLATYLNESGFSWGKTTRCFNRIYLSPEGKIDYFLYNFNSGEISPEKEQQFKVLLSQFIKNYQFPLTAKRKFAQCSPVSYQDF